MPTKHTVPQEAALTHELDDEMRGLALDDKRLNQRGRQLLQTLAAQPEASINTACQGWAETQAAYRFFDNDAVTPDALLEPHAAATMQRVRQQPVALIVQDTTELDYTAHPPTDSGCLNAAGRRGLFAHVHCAVTPERLNLGVLDIVYHDRDPATLGQTDDRAAWPIEDKESFRWLQGYRLACAVAAAAPETQTVSVADREADMYDIYVEAQKPDGVRAEYLIRSRVTRCTPERNPAAGPQTHFKVRERVAATAISHTRTLDLPATAKRAARTACVTIRAVTVTVKPPQTQPHAPAVLLNVVLVHEVDGPGDDTEVDWLLLTSLPIATVAEILHVVTCYGARWMIEVYFRTWKTGCRIEDIQLETVARLQRCLALYAIIAWRLVYVTQRGRVEPDLPCTTLFTTVEWQTVWRLVTKQAPPKTPPRLVELLALLATLGGYNRRKGDGPPGPQTIWVGLRRLRDFLLAWDAFTQSG